MIFGVGTDIVAVARTSSLLDRYGERALERILAPGERQDCRNARDPGRFLAKRFAAKEAFCKALGIGIRPPATLSAVAITHDRLGKPCFDFAPALASYMEEKRLSAQVSISDERDFAVAFVVLECG